METSCQSYCLQCAAGREEGVARQIRQATGLVALAPKLVRLEWKGSTAARKEQVLFPGYVFLYAHDMELNKVFGVHHMQRILAYGSGQRQLYGRDAEVASWILAYDGVIRESQALRVGERIVVVEGPMKDLGGVIKSVNKQRRRANVEFTFEGIVRSVWMAFDWVVPKETNGCYALG